jgi:beta-phosphoglucomutase-like phosphatase (HAD superfamily)
MLAKLIKTLSTIKEMRQINTVISDLDGTIANSIKIGEQIYGEVSDNYPGVRKVEPKDYSRLRKISTWQLIEE